MRVLLPVVVLILSMFLSDSLQAQAFPNPALLSTGQGAQGSSDPIWEVTGWYASNPPNPIGLTYTPALISNNCAPGAWVNPGSLPPPVNNGNWITNPSYPCSSNTNAGYIYFRLPLTLPPTCNGISIAAAGNYTLYLSGYSDNSISAVYVNGTIAPGVSGGGYSAGSQLNFSLTGPWVSGMNYVDVQVYNTPNGGQANPYGLLLVANTSGTYANGCPPTISGDTVICRTDSTVLWVPETGYSYRWSTGATTDSIKVSPVSATNYSVTITNTYGYRDSTTVRVLVNPLPVPTIHADTSICIGRSATLTASGGPSYLWSNTATTAAITVSPPVGVNTYTVTVTNANSCSATASATVTVHPSPVPAVIPSVSQICYGTNELLTASGGVAYLWSNSTGTDTNTVSPLATTTYSVTVTDANTCSATTSATVTVDPLPISTITPAATSICMGDSTTLTVPGGASYTWSNNANTNSIRVSPPTTTSYSVTVTSAHNCTASSSATVTVNPLPIPTITPATAQICFGSSVLLTASGGADYMWSNSANTDTTRVSPGSTTTYAVTVTDANLCSASTSRTVTVNPLPTPLITPASATICFGDSAQLTASGGASYVWSNSANSSAVRISPTSSTTYTVTVIDINLCSDTVSARVTVNPLPTPLINPISSAICYGNDTLLNATGGISYVWSTTATSPSIRVSPTATTTYSVTATDVNSCSAVALATVTVNPLPVVLITPAAVSICIGDSTLLTASGCSSYAWSSTANTSAIRVSPASTTSYTVTATDVNSCSAIKSATVTVNPLPIVAVSPTSIQICFGTSTTLTASGGVSYLWSNSANISDPTVSPASTTRYMVTATDANSCSDTTSALVIVNPLPMAAVSPVADICIGTSATLIASGGVSYLWSNNATTDTITVTPTTTTTYSVVVTDANNCSATSSKSVTVIPSMILTSAISNVSCFGGSDGVIDLTVNSGLSPYSYLWNNTSTTSSISSLSIGIYSVTITDQAGCQITASDTITQPPLLSLTSSFVNPLCETFNNSGSITINASGGTLPYQYLWSNNATNQNLSDITTGSYTVTVSDANNCTTGASFTLSFIYDFVVHTTPSDTIHLGDSAILGYSVSGHSGNFTSIWSPATALTCTDCVTPLARPDFTTLYHIELQNDSGCIATDSVIIYVIPDYNIYIPNAFTPNGDGRNDFFQIFGNLTSLKFLEVQIFDRWGEIVFQSNDINFYWDGTYRDKQEEANIFVYQMSLTFLDGHSMHNKGSLTLIR